MLEASIENVISHSNNIVTHHVGIYNVTSNSQTPSIDNLHHLPRLIRFKIVNVNGWTTWRWAMIDGKKINPNCTAPTRKTYIGIYTRLDHPPFNDFQSVFDPKEIVSKSSSSTESEKVCYQ